MGTEWKNGRVRVGEQESRVRTEGGGGLQCRVLFQASCSSWHTLQFSWPRCRDLYSLRVLRQTQSKLKKKMTIEGNGAVQLGPDTLPKPDILPRLCTKLAHTVGLSSRQHLLVGPIHCWFRTNERIKNDIKSVLIRYNRKSAIVWVWFFSCTITI